MSWHDLLAEDKRIHSSSSDEDEDDQFVFNDHGETPADDEEFVGDDDEDLEEEGDDGSEKHSSVIDIGDDTEDEYVGDSDGVVVIDDDSDDSNGIDDIEILSNAEEADSGGDGDEAGNEAVRAKMYDMEWSFLVLDEVQEARAPSSFRFQHVPRLPHNADHTLGMTATPFWNRPVDLLNFLRACGLDTSEPLEVDIPRPEKPLSATAAKRVREEYGDCHEICRNLLHFWHAVEYERQTIQRAVKALPSTHKTAAKAPTDAWDVLFPEGSSAAAKPLQKKWAVYIEWLKLVTAVLLALAG